jgi:HTH-type transcriptional regulator / antitoxin HigA
MGDGQGIKVRWRSNFQSDLSECMPASRVSEILNGRREISKEIARKLARRFKVSVEVFI